MNLEIPNKGTGFKIFLGNRFQNRVFRFRYQYLRESDRSMRKQFYNQTLQNGWKNPGEQGNFLAIYVNLIKSNYELSFDLNIYRLYTIEFSYNISRGGDKILVRCVDKITRERKTAFVFQFEYDYNIFAPIFWRLFLTFGDRLNTRAWRARRQKNRRSSENDPFTMAIFVLIY